MKLEIINTLGQVACTTEFETSSYDLETLRTMSKAGYRFRLDGRLVSFGNISKNVTPSTKINRPKETQSVIHDTPISKSTQPETAESIVESIPVSTSLTVSEGAADSTATRAEDIPVTLTSRTVRCIETGQMWGNQSLAAKELGIDASYISQSIKTGKPYKGMTFEKAKK